MFFSMNEQMRAQRKMLLTVILPLMTVLFRRRRERSENLLEQLQTIVSRPGVSITEVGDVLSEANWSRELSRSAALDEALYKAAKVGRVDIAKLLIKHGADVHYEDVVKQSPLRMALEVHDGDCNDMVRLLINNGANINRRNINGQTDFMMLMVSKKVSHAYIMDILHNVEDIYERDILSAGSFLHLVSGRVEDNDRPGLVRQLLNRGLPVNDLDNNDDTPLHLLASVACLQSVKCLVERGADIRAKNRGGETVLHYLASSTESVGFEETLEFLIRNGANVNEADKKGCTTIHHALAFRETTCTALDSFRKHGVEVNIRDMFGRNEIFHAVENIRLSRTFMQKEVERRMKIIEQLVQLCVSINQGDNLGITPLHLAAQRDDLTLLDGLLELGSDLTKRTQTGAIPLHWACQHYNMFHALLWWHFNTGIDINVQDNFGSTALHWAVWFRNDKAVQMLLQTRSDASIQDTYGDTAKDLAGKIHYRAFDNIFRNCKSMDMLELSDPLLKCNESDDIMSCPLLRYIKSENGRLQMDDHLAHLAHHKINMAAFAEIVESRENMGLYYNIQENIDVPDLFSQFTAEIARNIARIEPIFQSELQLAGSTHEGTKVLLPDEFDYVWYLTEFEKDFCIQQSANNPNGYLKLRLKAGSNPSVFKQYITSDGVLDCDLVLKQFYRLVNAEVTTLLSQSSGTRYECLLCTKFLTEFHSSLSSLKICYYGVQAKRFTVSMDVVPAIRIDHTFIDLPLDKPLVKHVLLPNSRICVVMKTPDRFHVKEFSLCCRISFASLEQTIIKAVPIEIKRGYILLKSLVESRYLPSAFTSDGTPEQQIITSYRLKTCFMHALDDAISKDQTALEVPSTGKRDMMLHWSKKILSVFKDCLDQKNMPTFFDPSKNLLSLDGAIEGTFNTSICRDLLTVLEHSLDLIESTQSEQTWEVVYKR